MKSVAKNGVASAIKTIAILTYIIGAIFGFFGLDEGIILGLAIWVAAAISGTFVLSLSEIIKLLHEINQKQDMIINK